MPCETPRCRLSFGLSGRPHLNPYYWRNDYAGIEQWSRFTHDGLYRYHTQLHAEHERFAKLWDRNLRQQSFAEAFDPVKHRRG